MSRKTSSARCCLLKTHQESSCTTQGVLSTRAVSHQATVHKKRRAPCVTRMQIHPDTCQIGCLTTCASRLSMTASKRQLRHGTKTRLASPSRVVPSSVFSVLSLTWRRKQMNNSKKVKKLFCKWMRPIFALNLLRNLLFCYHPALIDSIL